MTVEKVEFRGESLEIRQHALDQLIERWPLYEKTPLTNPLETLKKLLLSAHPQEPRPFRNLKRLLRNSPPSKFYFVNGWRLVVVANGSGKALVTVERAVKSKNWCKSP